MRHSFLYLVSLTLCFGCSSHGPTTFDNISVQGSAKDVELVIPCAGGATNLQRQKIGGLGGHFSSIRRGFSQLALYSNLETEGKSGKVVVAKRAGGDCLFELRARAGDRIQLLPHTDDRTSNVYTPSGQYAPNRRPIGEAVISAIGDAYDECEATGKHDAFDAYFEANPQWLRAGSTGTPVPRCTIDVYLKAIEVNVIADESKTHYRFSLVKNQLFVEEISE